MVETQHQHKEDHSKHLLMLGAAGLAGSVILAPYALPLIGLGSSDSAHMMMSFMGGEAAPGFFGSGIAGALQKGIAAIPGIGGALTSTAAVTIPGIGLTLTAGALTTILASAAIGIGGTLLANWMAKRKHEGDSIRWSKIIRIASLATSILISLPSILTGLSVGLTFLASQINADFGNQVAYAMGSDYGLGATSMTMGSAVGAGALGGLSAVLPHLFTCGGAVLPLLVAMFMGGKKTTANYKEMNSKDTETAPTYHCQLAAPCAPVRGQPCEVAFRLMTQGGRPLNEAELAIVHTRPLHTMIVDSSLRDYHHIHPEYDTVRQCFVAQFTPNLQSSYTMWNDFTMKGESAPTYVSTPLSAMRGIHLTPHITHTSHVEGDGIAVNIRPDSPLRAGGHHTLTLDIRDATGRPVRDLEPIMGAYAHLAAFSADGKHFIHTHPLGMEPTTDAARGTSPLHFHVMPEVEGPTKFFLQIQRNGEIQTIPFGQVIAPSREYDQRIRQQQAAAAALVGTVAHSH